MQGETILARSHHRQSSAMHDAFVMVVRFDLEYAVRKAHAHLETCCTFAVNMPCLLTYNMWLEVKMLHVKCC